MWRLVIYGIVAMAIPAYFFYPHLHDSRYSGLLYFMMLLLTAGMVAYFALIPWIIKRFRLASPERSRFIRPAFALVMIIIALTKLLQIHYR
jgi:Kef-type K+ transport system membrane component KefB